MNEISNGGTNNTSTDFYKENGTVAPFLSVNPTKLIQKTKVYKILETSSFFIKWNSFEKYIPERWRYSINLVLDLFSEILLSILFYSSLHLASPFHIIICWHVWLKRHTRIGACQGCVVENACPYHNRIWLWGCKATNYQVSCSLKEAILTGASITGKECICSVF
jgi:hypothetical protein